MKKSEVKAHIGREVRVAYVLAGRAFKSEALLHSADPVTEIAEVRCINGHRVKVHFSQLKHLNRVKKTVEEQLQTIAGNATACSAGQISAGFLALLEAYKTLKFYGDTRSWMESIHGKYLGQIMDVKWSAAQNTVKLIEKHVEENFI